MVVVEFDVLGMPGPQGSKRVVGHTKPKPGRKHGRALMVESSAKVKPWREAVKYAALQAMVDRDRSLFPLLGPLVVTAVFTLPKPASAPKRRTTFPDRKPDLSKLIRSTEDALTDAGLWRDDAQVIGYDALWKCYPLEGFDALPSPGCRIRVRQFLGT